MNSPARASTPSQTHLLAFLTLGVMVCAPAGVDAQSQRQSSATSDQAGMVVTTAWLAAHANDPGLSVLHVGADRETYEAGHIPGALFVALREIAVTREGTPNELPSAADLAGLFEKLGIGDSGRVVLYGDEQGLLAARLFFTLDYLGHGNRAALLDGGLETWRAEGRAVSTHEPAWSPHPFTPRLNPDVLVTLPIVRDVSWLVTRRRDAPWVLIDARPGAQFTGAEPGADIERPGHIPGANSVFWQRALVSTDRPVLRPTAELRRLYEEAGAAPGRAIVSYCRTGVQASFAYFVARYLGYRVKMYDGSFVEWSKAAGSEVATGR